MMDETSIYEGEYCDVVKRVQTLTKENTELKLESKTMKEINDLLRDEGPKMCKEVKELREKLAKNNLKLDEKVAKKYTWDTIVEMEQKIKVLEDEVKRIVIVARELRRKNGALMKLLDEFETYNTGRSRVLLDRYKEIKDER